MIVKNFERLLLNQEENKYIQNEKTVSDTQIGFQRQKSSNDALLHLDEILQYNRDESEKSVTFFDLAKGFNFFDFFSSNCKRIFGKRCKNV